MFVGAAVSPHSVESDRCKSGVQRIEFLHKFLDAGTNYKLGQSAQRGGQSTSFSDMIFDSEEVVQNLPEAEAVVRTILLNHSKRKSLGALSIAK